MPGGGPFTPFSSSFKTVGAKDYDMSVQIFTTGGQIIRQEGCFAFMFTNVGGQTATVNGMVVYPGTPGSILGDSRSISGHELDLFRGTITLTFVPGGGANPQVEIVQLYYLRTEYTSQ